MVLLIGKTGTAEIAKIGGMRVKMKIILSCSFCTNGKSKIAIAVMIENGGFGSAIAGPIASLLIEKYLRQNN
jgi:penicillin-binding protein 2